MKTKLPTPQLLPSGMYRCQVMVHGKRVSVVDSDSDIAQAKAVALKNGLIEKETKLGFITLSDAIDKYISIRKNVLSPSTARGYRIIQRNRLKSLMNRNVYDIDEILIQTAINEDAKCVSYKTIKNSVGLILSVLTDYVSINEKRIRYPQRIKKEHVYLDTNQVVKLIDGAKGNIAEIPILMAVWLGMRRSEILGLHWESVDFDKKQIKVERTAVPGEDGVMLEKITTKNESSRRTISCPDYILEKLRLYRPASPRNGPIFNIAPDTFFKNLKRISEASDIPFVGIHGLRHTNASIMLSLGVVDKVAMARGGWATDVTMKSIYQHVFLDDKVNADNIINSYIESLIKK